MLRIAIAAAFSCLQLVAQASHGETVPEPEWSQWLRGDPVPVGGEGAPACAVFVFFTRPADAAGAASEADYMLDLQRRFCDKGARFAAVVADKDAALPAWSPCNVAVDAELATTHRWCGADEGNTANVVVMDRRGTLVFLGRSDAGLVDAIDAALTGKVDAAEERAAFTLRTDLLAFAEVPMADTAHRVEAVVAHAPHDGLAFGLLYLTHAWRGDGEKEAAAVRVRALRQLAGEVRPLAAFADLALRGDGRAPGLAADLVEPLKAAAAAAPHDAVVQLAYLRALVFAGKSREIGRHAMTIRKLVSASAEHCLQFVEILTHDRPAAVHRDLAQQAVEKAEALGAQPRLLTAARYVVASLCQEDAAGAKTLLDKYLGDSQARVSINNDCWYLMTELPTMGRYDRFALALAERMLEQKDAMDAFEFDTAAMAMFVNGRFADAVDLQQTAITKGGNKPEYAERLARYKAAVGAAPR